MPDTVMGVPVQTGPGYTTDPYKDEGGECDDLVSKFIARFTGPGGLFSTWRERHIGIMGAAAGWRAGTTSLDGKCPPLWTDEAQYYEGMWMLFNLAKCQWPTISAFLLAIIGSLASGVVKIG